jgi:zinc protease
LRRVIAPAVVALSLAVFAVQAFAYPGLMQYTLKNGLKIYLRENHTAPVVYLSVTYKVGSKDEQVGQTGIAHILEHMMFKGTKNLPVGEIDRQLTAVGAVNNASTWTEATNYWEMMPVDAVDTALRIERERMVNGKFVPSEHAKEMVVVRNELERDENDPGTLLYYMLNEVAFLVHPYHHPIIGFREDVENITTKQVENYYKSYYHPGNAFIIAIGDFNADAFEKKIASYFEDVPSPATSLPRLTAEPEQRGERRFVVKKAGENDYVEIGYHVPNSHDPDTYARDVLTTILGGGVSSRLYRALVATGKATAAFAWNNSNGLTDPWLIVLGGNPVGGVTPDEVEKIIESEVDRLISGGVTDDELARAKKQLRVQFTYARDSLYLEADLISDRVITDNVESLDTYIPQLDKVTGADVVAAAKKYLTQDNRTVGCFVGIRGQGAPGGGGVPTGMGGAHAKPALPETADAKPIRSNEAVLPDASSGSQNATPAADVPAWAKTPDVKTLPNGLRVVVRENHNNPTVSFDLIIAAGSVFDPPGKAGASAMVTQLVQRGTTRRTEEQIGKETDEMGAEVEYRPTQEYVEVSARSLKEDFPHLLDLVADEVSNSTLAPEEIEKVRAAALTDLQADLEDTYTRAFYTACAALYGADNPYAINPRGTEAGLKSLTRDDLLTFYRGCFEPSNAVLAVVGDVTPDEAFKLAAEKFGAWRPMMRDVMSAYGRSLTTVKPVAFTQVDMKEKSQIDYVLVLPGIGRTDPDYYKAILMAQILGGGLTSRLSDELREKQGLTYGTFSDFQAGRGAGPFVVQIGVNPKLFTKAQTGLLGVLADMAKGDVTEKEVDDNRNYLIGSFKTRLVFNTRVAQTLAYAVWCGVGADYIAKRDGYFKGVTVADVDAMAAKFIKMDCYASAGAGTFEEK